MQRTLTACLLLYEGRLLALKKFCFTSYYSFPTNCYISFQQTQFPCHDHSAMLVIHIKLKEMPAHVQDQQDDTRDTHSASP